jgi:glycosyltransferase involved in cell wall biosynthesis
MAFIFAFLLKGYRHILNNYVHTPLHFCVLIPCFNDEPGLVQALKSITYSFEHCLAVVVDDGSSTALEKDRLVKAVDTGLDIFVIRLEKNRGITTALNTGLHWIVANTSAPYIGRLDCRDLCHPERFYKQVAYLNSHPETGLLGTWCRFEEERSNLTYDYKAPVEDAAIKKAMPLRNVFIHPTVMFRTALVKGGHYYPDVFAHAEDYGFFWQLLQVTKGAILPEFLVTCAITRTGISYKNRKEQLQSRKKVVQQFAPKGWTKTLGLIKINLLIVVPKAVLLRLKGLRNNI